MAAIVVAMNYHLQLNAEELRLVSRALRGDLTDEEKPRALEIQERMMLSRAQQTAQIAEETAKTASNIERKKGGR